MLTFTKSMLALSVMAAVGGANAATYTEDTTLTDKIFTEGIVAINGATVTVTGDEIAGKWFKATNYSQDVGSKYSYEQSKLLLGNADTKKITINNSSTGFVAGLEVSGPANDKPEFAGSQIVVTSKDLVMNLHSENDYVYGINAMNASTNRRDENSELVDGAKETVKVVINAENTIINATTGTDIDSKEALQKPLLPSRMEQKCSVQFFLTTPGGAVFFTNIIVKYYYDHIHNLVILWKSCSMAN